MSWNLFHGRDSAPDPALHTWRSRLLRRTERGEAYAQVNCDLFGEFAGVLQGAEWDVALLQECPPRWAERLATACGAEPHLVLTSRNLPPLLVPLQRLLAHANPDLIASWEGGANLTLIRTSTPADPLISERRELTLTRAPELRRMAFTRLGVGLCVANLHASTGRTAAESELELAVQTALGWAAGEPLIIGGDFNIRPRSSSAFFDALADRWALSEPTDRNAIDHVLARGLEILGPPAPWTAERREVPDPTHSGAGEPLRVLLSDHSPVEARFGLAGA